MHAFFANDKDKLYSIFQSDLYKRNLDEYILLEIFSFYHYHLQNALSLLSSHVVGEFTRLGDENRDIKISLIRIYVLVILWKGFSCWQVRNIE